ncbi:hypothetical protein ABN034_34075 [Actinopolymorpha sp. B11F2]|uniref:hypothetical protein n=1 Tax=Actinopolymorpha sp. B11F2 TaxID=3160862 RepID=UPI0032E3AA4C
MVGIAAAMAGALSGCRVHLSHADGSVRINIATTSSSRFSMTPRLAIDALVESYWLN